LFTSLIPFANLFGFEPQIYFQFRILD
jgi:hypothetical protein